MNALGQHLLVELKDCKKGALQNVEAVRETMVNAARVAGATIIEVSFHEFSPFGVSGMIIIAESHLSIHTWPEYDYAAIDIFTCGDILKTVEATQYLIEAFGSKNPSVVEMKRGILSPTGNAKLPHKCSIAGAHTQSD